LSEQPIPETCSASGTRSGQLLGFLFGLAPDGVFRASAIALGAVGSYPAFSPLPPAEARGGLFSVALSVERQLSLPPEYIPRLAAEVTRHRALWSSDFPPPSRKRDGSDPPPFQNQRKPSVKGTGWQGLKDGSTGQTHLNFGVYGGFGGFWACLWRVRRMTPSA